MNRVPANEESADDSLFYDMGLWRDKSLTHNPAIQTSILALSRGDWRLQRRVSGSSEPGAAATGKPGVLWN